ncbi:hypothetical protein D3OALGA1CA_5195 [Olavius algarvensis associated proteobacterium Delta 3]|nr:hypothetical protein D3OALGB2SA_2697 [Olavius algarvensis associated proteobacterium Delta 3]CAB5163246.1 hypothetical protein D3OALGA1CA_5195 [Olavius algarvensis associated proteobacterium Delta 3]
MAYAFGPSFCAVGARTISYEQLKNAITLPIDCQPIFPLKTALDPAYTRMMLPGPPM